MAGFVLLVALTGGSSRPDIASLVLLRPIAPLFCVYALLVASADQLREARSPMLIVGALMAIALLQLVPLPATLWTQLQNREVVAEAAILLGMESSARALSLDPNRTWNAFFALFVPLTAVCLAAVQRGRFRERIVLLLAAAALLSAGVAFLQAISGNRLHLYDISHVGFPVGLFANKNHQSVMLLWLMLTVSWIAATADGRRFSPNAAIGAALGAILVLFPLLVLTGSRAGLLLSVPALALCGWLVIRAPATHAILKRAGSRAKLVRACVVAIVVAPLLVIFAMLATSGRQSALSRLFEMEAGADVRWQYLPIMKRMALDFLPLGSGFGSFESVFNMYEPAQMLTTRYMNQAHNDLLQIVIEGGLPALAILLAALAWLSRALWRLGRSPRSDDRRLAVFHGGGIALWLAASLVDYPLRTPLAAMLVACLTAHLAMRSTAARSRDDTAGKRGV